MIAEIQNNTPKKSLYLPKNECISIFNKDTADLLGVQEIDGILLLNLS